MVTGTGLELFADLVNYESKQKIKFSREPKITNTILEEAVVIILGTLMNQSLIYTLTKRQTKVGNKDLGA